MASSSRVDQATIAFRRVLAEANAGEQARVDALVVLSQRTVYAATWPGQNQAARTLTNSDGESALPLFTGLDVLDETATRFGWRNPDGSLQFRELGAREALRHALARGVHFVVIDIGCDHSVEFARAELEPLLQLQSQRSGTGPYAATGERQAAILEAVRRSSSRPPHTTPQPANTQTPVPFTDPGSTRTGREASLRQTVPSPPTAARRPSSSMPAVQPPVGASRSPSGMGQGSSRMQPPPTPSVSAPHVPPPTRRTGPSSAAVPAPPPGPHTPAPTRRTGPNSAAMPAPAAAPARPNTSWDASREEPGTGSQGNGAGPRNDEPTLAERPLDKSLLAPRIPLADALLQGISSGLRAFPEVEWACVLSDGTDVALIGVRVDPSFLNRVADITDAIMDVGEKHSMPLQVMLLNNQDLVKNARRQGKAFYPWRR